MFAFRAPQETLSLTAPFWNAVVRSMRGRDLLSNREAEALSFVAVSLSPASMMATWRRNGSVGEFAVLVFLLRRL